VEGPQPRFPKQLPAWFLYDAEAPGCSIAIAATPSTATSPPPKPPCWSKSVAMAARSAPRLPYEFGCGRCPKVCPCAGGPLPLRLCGAWDISSRHLTGSLRHSPGRHPATAVLGICCDYSQLQEPAAHPLLRKASAGIGFYPGSSPGQLSKPPPGQGVAAQFAELLGPDGCC